MVVKGFGSLPYTIRHHQESPFLFIYLINFIFFLTQFAPRGILSSLGIAAQKSFSGLGWAGGLVRRLFAAPRASVGLAAAKPCAVFMFRARPPQGKGWCRVLGHTVDD